MKKSASFVLLLLIVGMATAANAAHVNPLFGQPYYCDYSPGPWTTEADPGISAFANNPTWINPELVYGIEGFESTVVGWDNRKIAFAKPVDWCGIQDPDCRYSDTPIRTSWEFTIKDGVQCKDTRVSNNGRRIVYLQCTNGKTRTCNAF